MTTPVNPLDRVRTAVLEALDNPADTLNPEHGQRPGENDTEFACRAAIQVLIAIAVVERAARDMDTTGLNPGGATP